MVSTHVGCLPGSTLLLAPASAPALLPRACLGKHAQLRLGSRKVEEAAVHDSIPDGVPPAVGGSIAARLRLRGKLQEWPEYCRLVVFLF